MTTSLMIALGLVLLAGGGEVLVRGAVGAAQSLGVSPLLIGLTLVGFGTSTPELVTSLTAALEGSPGIAVGNVVGSNTANILLILGVAALLMPLAVAPGAFRRDGFALVGAGLGCMFAVLVGELDRGLGGVFLLLLVGYIVWAYRSERAHPDAETAKHEHVAASAPHGPRNLWLSIGLALLGITLTIAGARMLVGAAVDLARGLGISDTVVGLTIVAVGTSLPELVTSGVAALRRQADVALGNIVGSNIYNVFGILGATALLQPISVPPEIARFDIWVMLAATVLLTLFLRTGWVLKRWEGGVFLLLYGTYVTWLVANA